MFRANVRLISERVLEMLESASDLVGFARLWPANATSAIISIENVFMAVSFHLRFWNLQNLMSGGCHNVNEPNLNAPFMLCLEGGGAANICDLRKCGRRLKSTIQKNGDDRLAAAISVKSLSFRIAVQSQGGEHTNGP